jgi:hypothetical protein
MWNCFSVKTPSRGSDQCEGNARTLAFVAELVYARILGVRAFGYVGSSPIKRT